MYPHREQPGEGAFVWHQVEALRALGHRVEVVHVRGYQSRWNYLTGALRVFGATWKTSYDVVHVHYGLTGLSALLRWRTPMVVTLHGSDVLQGTLQPFISRLVSKVAAATIVVSPELAARCPGVVIPCGVDLQRFRRVDRTFARETLGLPAATTLVLFPFDPARSVKRYDVAEAAVGELSKSGMDVALLPVWKVPNDQMPLYYSAADVMLLCSDTEGSPTSIKEALACELPIVSTDVGDVRTLLSGVDGAAICDATSSSLAAGIRRLLSTKQQFNVSGRVAMQRYGQETTVRAIEQVYRAVACAGSRQTATTGSLSS
jgi:teichuronic acid biosynthesis glycosyltransferase TuaC